MSLEYEQLAFENESIRDTSDHWSILLDNRGYRYKTIIVENSLNQNIIIECWASRNADFSNSFQVGDDWPVNSSTNTFQICDNYFPYMKLKVTCSIAPNSGNLTIAVASIEH